MRKIVIIIFIFFIISTMANAVENQLCGVGIGLLKDSWGKKTFVLQVIPSSPAEEYGIPVGAEIISVNNVKIKQYTLSQISEMITGEEGTTVNLLIKYKGKKTNYEIIRAKFNVPQKKEDKNFILHWNQVAPEEIDDVYIPENIAKKVSRNCYLQYVRPVNYWYERKTGFKKGYDACMSYPKSDQNACLMNLVNREITKTDNDRQIEIQQQIARQQATQNFVNTMNQIQTNNHLNNINNSLQQQNFQLQNTNMQLYNINNTLRSW